MRLASMISAVLLALYGVIVLLQLWFEIFNGPIFWKITVTFVVVLVVTVGVSLIKRDYVQDKKMKDEHFID